MVSASRPGRIVFGSALLISLSFIIIALTSSVSAQPEIQQGERINQTFFNQFTSLFSVTGSTYQQVEPGETITFTAEPVMKQDTFIEGDQKVTRFYECETSSCDDLNLLTEKRDTVIWGVSLPGGSIYAWSVQVTFPDSTGYYKTSTYLDDGTVLTSKYERFFVAGSDPDRDNVFGESDLCPETAGSVSHSGCPDSDGDGVFDDVDECPNTGASEFGLKSNGCPVSDGDLDGVGDVNDDCPDAFGSKSDGCPTLFEGILHWFDKTFGTGLIGGGK